MGVQRPTLLEQSFWQDLRVLAAPDCTLLVNTLYEARAPMERLACTLTASGWSDVQQHVDRGLQAEAGEERRPTNPQTWQPRDNMIFSATNR